MLKGEWRDRQTRRNCDGPKFGGSFLFLIGNKYRFGTEDVYKQCMMMRVCLG